MALRVPFTGREALEAGTRASRREAPRWTMRGRSAPPRPRVGESPEAGLVNLDAALKAPPKWSMMPRTFYSPPSLQTPGPGHYEMPSVVGMKAPTLTKPRLTNIGHGMERGKQPPKSRTPGPGHYMYQTDVSRRAQPKWSMPGRPTSAPAGSRGCAAAVMYDVRQPSNTPSWSLKGRPEDRSLGRPTPGPGHYKPPVYSDGKLKRPAKWSFGGSERFPANYPY